MANSIKIFENKDLGAIRTLIIDKEPFFVGKDVAQILGYSNTKQAIIKHIHDEDKINYQCETNGGLQTMVIINESGLYSLILGSKLASAREFKHWVTKDILPKIRRSGIYVEEALLENPELLVDAMTKLLQNYNFNKKSLEVIESKANYYDYVLDSKNAVTITAIAKDYGHSGKWLNALLHNLRVQYFQNGIWLLYSEYAYEGYTRTKTHIRIDENNEKHSYIHTYWTQKGRNFIYNVLASIDVYPLKEVDFYENE